MTIRDFVTVDIGKLESDGGGSFFLFFPHTTEAQGLSFVGSTSAVCYDTHTPPCGTYKTYALHLRKWNVTPRHSSFKQLKL